jgi:hypothetical protein
MLEYEQFLLAPNISLHAARARKMYLLCRMNWLSWRREWSW